MVYHYFSPSSSSVLCGGWRLRKLPSPEGERGRKENLLLSCLSAAVAGDFLHADRRNFCSFPNLKWNWIKIRLSVPPLPPSEKYGRKRKSKKTAVASEGVFGVPLFIAAKVFPLLGHFRTKSIVGTAGWAGDLLWGAGAPLSFSRYLSPFYASFLTYCFFLPPSLQGYFFCS